MVIEISGTANGLQIGTAPEEPLLNRRTHTRECGVTVVGALIC
jgi:hypothetical protein